MDLKNEIYSELKSLAISKESYIDGADAIELKFIKNNPCIPASEVVRSYVEAENQLLTEGFLTI